MTHELNRQEGGTGMIVVENYIEVKAGLADLVLERFKSPKSVHTFPGFVRMDVLHSKLNDETEVVRVCTTWENEEAFHAWSSSDSFRHAHNRRAEAKQSESSDIAVTSTSAHGAHGAGKDSKNGEPSTGPITGNRVTIHQVVVTHLPSEAHVSSILT
ncbi:antibiotic biosynthesis monooxygenase [Paenibacillus shirakamiensis]